jgi:hypothetical protein
MTFNRKTLGRTTMCFFLYDNHSFYFNYIYTIFFDLFGGGRRRGVLVGYEKRRRRGAEEVFVSIKS